MIAVKDLTKEEVFELIDAIPLEFARNTLKENSTIFNRLFPGATIKKLNTEKMQKSFKNNYKDPFVQNCVYAYLKTMKAAVDQKQSELEEEGYNENDSFIMSLSEVIIPKLHAIYLKYHEIPYDDNLLSAINCYMNSTKKSKELEMSLEKQAEHISALEHITEKNTELLEKYNNLEHEHQELLEEKSILTDKLKQTHEELMQIRSYQSFQVKKTIPAENPYKHNDPKYIYSSFGRIYDYGNEKRLKRLRNIEGNMLSEINSADDGLGFEYLYIKNDQTSDGLYGVWDWFITPNIKDSSREIALSNHNLKCQPISICFCSDISSFDDLLISLKNGIEATPLTKRVMFVIPSENEQYLAVLCDDSEIVAIGGKIRLKDNIIFIRKYIINQTDIIEVNNNIFFYKFIAMPIPGEYISVENSLEIVKKIVLERATRNVASLNNIERKDRQSFRNMIKAIPSDDVFKDIMEKCMCDEDEAKRLITELEHNAEQLLNGDDIAYEILVEIINSNEELLTKCETIVEEKWKKKNQSLIDNEQARLQVLSDKCNDKQKETDDLDSQLTALKAEIDNCQNSIKEREKLADDVETKIKKKIEDARNNAADFIAEMSFISPVKATNYTLDKRTADIIKGRVIPNDSEIIEYSSAQELLNELLYDNMTDAGISKEINKAFSAFLYSAHVQNIPIILAGPNGIDIVNAYSSSISGKEVDVFDCSVKYSNEVLYRLVNNDSDITVVKNIFNSEWITHIADIIKAKSYIVFICPFAEDLIIEPKSLYNYAVPVFTELLVSSSPQEITIFGQAKSTYTEFNFLDNKNDRIKYSIVNRLVKNIGMGTLLTNNLSSILTGVSALCSNENSEHIMEILCGCVPYLYVCHKIDKLIELIDTDSNIMSETRRQIKNLIGVDNE